MKLRNLLAVVMVMIISAYAFMGGILAPIPEQTSLLELNEVNRDIKKKKK